MPVLYEGYQNSLKNKEGKKLFYPRVVRTGNVGTDVIAEEIAKYSSLTTGDVKNTIDNLITVMTQHLQASESVTLDGFGTFSLVMKSKGKGAERMEDVTSQQSELVVRFHPTTRQNPDRTTATRSFVTGAKCKRYDRATGTVSGEEEKPGSGGNEGGGEEGGGI